MPGEVTLNDLLARIGALVVRNDMLEAENAQQKARIEELDRPEPEAAAAE